VSSGPSDPRIVDSRVKQRRLTSLLFARLASVSLPRSASLSLTHTRAPPRSRRASEGEAPPYAWTSLEPLKEGEEEAPTGNFVKAAGRAKAAYPNGDTYEGAFNELKQKHGKSTYQWSTATGANAWVPEEGFPEGKAPSVKYDGQYVEGVKRGVGKLSLPNGDRYHGMWDADKFHGDGTYYYANGDVYSGGWVRGVKQGKGTFFVAADESQLVGDWDKGSMVSGKWVWKDGTSWQGPFKASSPLGKGIFYFPNDTVQEGEYVQEGDVENPDAELRTVWKGGVVRPANTKASEVTRSA
jgi:hypothetical protein